MKKYIVGIMPKGFPQNNAFGISEELACEIISCYFVDSRLSKNLVAFEVGSELATYLLVSNAGKASIEINESNAEFWANEIVEIRKSLAETNEILNNSILEIVYAYGRFDRLCENSLNFQGVEIASEINMGDAFELLCNSGYYQVSEVVRSLFKVQVFSKV
jgi:hypothetical protein